ncbi:unnamed protein product [Brassica oleracea]
MAIFKQHNHHLRSVGSLYFLQDESLSSPLLSLSKTNATKHSQSRQKISPVLPKVVPFDQRDDMATVAWLSYK